MIYKKFLLLFILFFSSSQYAHDFLPAHLKLDEKTSNLYKASFSYPLINTKKELTIVFPEFCKKINSNKLIKNKKYQISNFELQCSKSIQDNQIILNNLSYLTDFLVTINFSNGDVFNGIGNVQNSSIFIPANSKASLKSFFGIGFNHLLEGYDHIVFLLALIFLINKLITLIKVITSFTIAHSITLFLTSYELIVLSSIFVEIMIALTIIYLALEIDKKKINEFKWQYSFIFGLLHGMGFSGALSEIGINNDQLLGSLLLFNIGLEVAQILLILFFFIFLKLFELLKLTTNLKNLLSYGIGGIGFYWFIDRVIVMIGF
jgi:hypothetical protein